MNWVSGFVNILVNPMARYSHRLRPIARIRRSLVRPASCYGWNKSKNPAPTIDTDANVFAQFASIVMELEREREKERWKKVIKMPMFRNALYILKQTQTWHALMLRFGFEMIIYGAQALNEISVHRRILLQAVRVRDRHNEVHDVHSTSLAIRRNRQHRKMRQMVTWNNLLSTLPHTLYRFYVWS